MRQRLTCCDGAVVTAHTIVGNAGVTERRRNPRGRAVAGAAIGRGNYVVARLAGGRRAVVTTGAGAGDLVVIDAYGRRPRQRAMTGLAGICGGDMTRRFTRRRGAVVAAKARACGTAVIEMRRRPRGRGVA